MSTSADPYLLASTILTPEELPKLALITYDPASAQPNRQDASGSESNASTSDYPPHMQRIFVIVSNVSFGVEQSCVLVIKPRRKDPSTAALLSVIPVLPDLKIDIEPQQGLTASAATPRNSPPAATTLGLSSLPQTLPTIHTLLEKVVPDLSVGDKAESSNAALKVTLSHGAQSASGVTSDARGLKDFLSVLKDLLKVAQENAFSADTTHKWMEAYSDDISSHAHNHTAQNTGTPQLETPIFSRFSNSSFVPSNLSSAAAAIPRPASPTADDIRVSVGTFNVNGHLPQDDIPGIIGLKKWLKAEEDPDLIVTGFQEVDTSGGAYFYYSPAKEEAWSRAITRALGRRADRYRKLAAKQLVGMLIIVFARTSLDESISEVATASVGVGLGGFVANKGAVAVRLKLGQRSICFVNSHLSAFEGLQAMERRCWDWSEIYRRLRFRLAQPKIEDFWETPATAAEAEEVRAKETSDLGDSSTSQPTNPFKTVKDAAQEVEANGASQSNGDKEGTVPQVIVPGDSDEDIATKMTNFTVADDADAPPIVAKDSPQVDVTASWQPSDEASPYAHLEHTITSHDVIIHLGDLNFRLDLSHSEAHRLIRQRQYSLLYRYDQLESLRTSGSLFDDFEEGEITFAPTYKFDKGTDRYDTSDKQRVPAWTDRIMWCTRKEWEDEDGVAVDSATAEGGGEGDDEKKKQEKQRREGIVLQSYEAVTDLKFSDHRPVRATFLIRIR